VQAYPGPGIRKQVSVDGGDSPFWSHTGHELFYQTATAIFSVPILNADDLRVGTPVRLFSHVRISGNRPSISADDQRFLLLERAASVPSQLHLIQGWFEELKARVK